MKEANPEHCSSIEVNPEYCSKCFKIIKGKKYKIERPIKKGFFILTVCGKCFRKKKVGGKTK